MNWAKWSLVQGLLVVLGLPCTWYLFAEVERPAAYVAAYIVVWLERLLLRTVAEIISHSWMDATCSSTSAGKRIF